MKTDLKIPQLSVEGKEVAENILKEFEENMKIRAGGIIKDMFDEFYVSYANYIEQDSWHNIRQHYIDLLCNYNHLTEQDAYTAKRLRERVYKDFKEEMTNDIIKDLEIRVKDLEDELNRKVNHYQIGFNKI